MSRASVLAAALLAGCVSVEQIPLSAPGAEKLREREITVSVRERPDFAAFTPGAAVFGAIGGALTIAEGNRLVIEHAVEDPAASIGQALAEGLRERYGVRASGATVRVNTDDVAQLARENAALDLVLDVRTVNWSFLYFPTSWNRYRVLYSARTRLIDVRQARVVAEGFCSRAPEQTPDAPTYDELLANRAQRLKSELQLGAQSCLQQIWSPTFALAGSPPTIAVAASAPTIATALAVQEVLRPKALSRCRNCCTSSRPPPERPARSSPAAGKGNGAASSITR